MALVLHGAAYSAYTRIARIVLEEKSISHEFREIDFISEGFPAGLKHPFTKVPVLEADEQNLIETLPICLYLDEKYPAPALMPEGAAARARVLQCILALDNYIWPDIRDLATQRIFAPFVGGWPDDDVTGRMEARLEKSLSAFTGLLDDGTWLIEDGVSLADCHAAPMFAYLAETVEGQGLLASLPRLKAWWEAMQKRGSFAATAFSFEDYAFAQKDQD